MTTEQLKKRLDRLQEDGGHFTIEDFVQAEKAMQPGEAQAEAMHRLWPAKVEHPWLIGKALEQEECERIEWSDPANAGEMQE